MFLRIAGWEVREDKTADSGDEWYVGEGVVLLSKFIPGKPPHVLEYEYVF